MCAIQVRVLHNAHIHVLHTSVRRVHHWYKLRNLWATDAMCPVHHWCNVRTSVCYIRPCADTRYVRVLHMSVCYVHCLYKQPTSDVVRVLVSVWTTNTSNKSKCRVHDCYKLHTSTQFFSSFYYYIRDLHILHASFSTCASDLNKTDGLRELARDWQRF